MFRQINPNPLHKSTGDCSVRALSLLFEKPWEETYIELCSLGLMRAEMPSSNSVIDTYMKNKGYLSAMVSVDCPNCITVSEFCERYPHGRYLLAIGDHVVCCAEGDYLDSFDSGDEVVAYYYYLP